VDQLIRSVLHRPVELASVFGKFEFQVLRKAKFPITGFRELQPVATTSNAFRPPLVVREESYVVDIGKNT